MSNDILNTLNKILSDENNSKLISGLISSISKNETPDNTEQQSENEITPQVNKKALEIQKKIDVLTSLVPLFEEKNRMKIEKIISALKIIKTLLSIT